MKHWILLLFSFTWLQNLAAQTREESDVMLILFTNTFEDSVQIEVDTPYTRTQIKLQSETCTGWCDYFMLVPFANVSQTLNIHDIKSDKTIQVELDNRYRILYISKHYGKYDFRFSNELSLPCGTGCPMNPNW